MSPVQNYRYRSTIGRCRCQCCGPLLVWLSRHRGARWHCEVSEEGFPQCHPAPLWRLNKTSNGHTHRHNIGTFGNRIDSAGRDSYCRAAGGETGGAGGTLTRWPRMPGRARATVPRGQWPAESNMPHGAQDSPRLSPPSTHSFGCPGLPGSRGQRVRVPRRQDPAPRRRRTPERQDKDKDKTGQGSGRPRRRAGRLANGGNRR